MTLVTGRWRRPWALVLACAHLAWPAAAEDSGAPSSDSALAPGEPVQLSTIWFLPGDPSDLLTFFLEVDARHHLAPAPSSTGRRAMVPPLRFEPVCVAPCSIQLPHGTYSIAMGRYDGGGATARAALSVTRDTRVVGRYRSARWRRVLGTTLIVTSVVVGAFVGLTAIAAAGSVEGESPATGSAALLCAGTLSVGTFSGIMLLATGSDSAAIE